MPTDVALTSLVMPLAEFPAIAREAETRGYRTAWVGEAFQLRAMNSCQPKQLKSS